MQVKKNSTSIIYVVQHKGDGLLFWIVMYKENKSIDKEIDIEDI